MKISDLSVGQELKILVSIGEQQLEFPSSVEQTNPKKKLAYLAPAMKNGKILNFNGKGILTSLLVQLPDSKPLVFRNVTLNTIKKGDGTFCYGMECLSEGLELNRRGAFRCSIDLRTVLRVGLNRTTFDVILRDVSTTGFSFVFCNSDGTCEVGNSVHSVLNDYLEESCENFSFQLYGMIVRSEELKNGRVVYGCRLVTPVHGLDQYIAKRERLRIQKQRGK